MNYSITYVYSLHTYVTRFAKTRHNSALIYRNLFYCTIMFWALKAFFCSNIKSALQSNSQLQAVKAIDAIRTWPLIYTAITYNNYFEIKS